MGWGILIIILLQCTAARAAPMQDDHSLNSTSLAEMNQTPLPEAFSLLGSGSSTIIYLAMSMVSKNYIINLGDAKDRLIKDISASCDAISTQDNMCKENPASCPMAQLNKSNYGSAMKKNFQTMAALGRVCETGNRRTSTEAIELCTEGKDWIVPELATAPFTFLDMMQNGFNNDFLKLEMEKIHTTIKKRSLSPAMLLTGPLIIAPG